MTQIIPQSSVTPINEFRGSSSREPTKHADKSKGMTIDELSPLVKPGEYQMAYIGRFTAYMHGHSPKLALRFRIVDIGEFFEVELTRWYNMKRLIGKPGNNGRFVPPRHGGFLLEYATLFPAAISRNSRLDRLSFKPFKSTIVTAEVETVKRGSDKKEPKRPEVLQYSTIRKLLRAGT